MPQLNETTGQDFQDASDREAFNRHLDKARGLKAQREQEEASEPAAPKVAETREEWQPNEMASGQEIMAAGRRSLGLSDDWQPPNGANIYGGMSEADKVFRAGLKELNISESSYTFKEAQKAWGRSTEIGGAVAKDVGHAAMDPVGTASQVPGGLIDMWNEVNQFGIDLGSQAALALGIDPAIVELNKGIAEFTKLIDNPIEEHDTVTGNLVRGISQFAVPFTGGLKAMKAANILQKPGVWREMSRYTLSGFATDFAAFDPEMQRLTDIMDEAGLPVIEYLKSDEDDSEWESRFKNALEGSALGLLADGAFNVARGIKNMRKLETGLNDRIRAVEAEEADAAQVIERDIYAQGDPNGPLVETFTPPRAETAAEVSARREAAAPEPVVAGERYFDEDIFDIAARPTEGDELFAFSGELPNRERFLSEEIAARPTEAGDMVGFSTRAGNVGVQFMRDVEGTEIVWDWLDNVSRGDGDAAFEARELGSIRDANELLSKMFAVVERDAATNAAPVYTFSATGKRFDKLEKVYQRLAPKLAKRMGYEAEFQDGAFRIVRSDIDQGFSALRGLFDDPPVNDADRVARAQKANSVRGRPRDEFDTPFNEGGQPASQAAQSIARELDSQRSRFAADGSVADFISTEDSLARLDELRQAGAEAFGKDYGLLEQDGRITFARNAAELDPEWQRFASSAQAVTAPGGRITIFTETTRPQDMEGLLLHEVGIHSGMQDMIGEVGFESLLKRVDDLIDGGDAAALRARERVPASTPEADIRHETLAYLVQHAPKSTVVKELVAKVKAWAANTFPELIGRLKLNEADFRQLAVMAMRREAIISGEVVAMFGRIGDVFELGREPAKRKPMFNLSGPLLLTDRISIDGGVRVSRALDIDAKPDELVAQVQDMKEGLLSDGMVERLFDADEAFDPFVWRDTVEAISAGDQRPELIERFQNAMRPLEESTGATAKFSMFDEDGKPRKPQHSDGTKIEVKVTDTQFKASSPKGEVNAYQKEDAIQISSTFVEEAERGKGHGVELYEAMAQEAFKDGRPLLSDRSVTPDAANAWQALARRGYDVWADYVPPFSDANPYGHASTGNSPFVAVPPGSNMTYAEAIAASLPHQRAALMADEGLASVPVKLPKKPGRTDGSMFSMREAPGRLDDRINSIVLDDIKSGRRGLSPEESDALLGAAERWASAVRAQQPQRSRALNDLIEQIKSRNDPDDMADLVAIMEGAKAQTAEPPSLMKFLRRQGGLKDDGGELTARDLQRVNAVNNRSGIDLDTATQRAWEAGYIGKPSELEFGPTAEGRPTINDLLDAMDRELAGDMVYSRNDLDWVMEAAARQDMRAELENLGIDPNASRKQIMSEFERVAAIQEGTPVTLRDIRDLERIEAQSGARPGIGLPDRDLLGGNDVRINFNAINTGDDIRSVMGQLADRFSGEIENARGPKRGNADIIRSARQKRAWDALNERRGDTPLSDSEVPAAQALYIASAENVKQALDLAAREGSDTAHYKARRAITMHRAVQAEIAGAKADASRALRAWSVSQSATAQARRELNSVLESYGGKMDPEEMARLRTMLDAEPEAADKAIRTMGRKAADVLGEVLRFAWLSGPHTHIMNMAGNSLTLMYDIGLRAGSGIKGVVTKDPTLRRELSLAAAEYAGLMAGVRAQFSAYAKKADYGRMGKRMNEAREAISQGNIRQGLKTTASALAYDNPVSATFRGRFDDRGVSGRKFDGGGAGPNRAVSSENFGMTQGTAGSRMVDGIGALLSAPVDFLGFQDDFFKGINEMATRYRRAQEITLEELDNGLAREDAQRRMAELVENPPEEVLAEARQVAQRRTFTEPVGKATRHILGLRDWGNRAGFAIGAGLAKVTGIKPLQAVGFPLGHVLLPFVVTPSNILKFAFQNGPSGIMFRSILEDLEAGGPRRALAQSRIAAGTGLLAIGADLTARGIMTGAAPGDPGERELWQRDGRQEYAIKIGDKWVSYRRLEPVSTMMAIGADLQTIFLNSELEDDPDRDMAEVMGPVMGAMIQVVTSKTYLTSASEFVKFAEDPERYGPNWLERLSASIMAPAALSQLEEIQDPVIREASSITERWMSRMPGFSKELPVAYDLWGRQRNVSSQLGDTYDALSPFTVRTADPEPIDQELKRIGFFPRRPPKQISVRTPSGVSVAVNLRNRPEIWSRYVQLAGNEAKAFNGMGLKDYLNAVIEKRHPDSGDYYILPDSATEPISKEKFIDRRIQQARRVARFELEREFRADLQAMAQASLEAKRRSEVRAGELTQP